MEREREERARARARARARTREKARKREKKKNPEYIGFFSEEYIGLLFRRHRSVVQDM